TASRLRLSAWSVRSTDSAGLAQTGAARVAIMVADQDGALGRDHHRQTVTHWSPRPPGRTPTPRTWVVRRTTTPLVRSIKVQWRFRCSGLVVRGGVEPPTFRFSVTVISADIAACGRRFVQPMCSKCQFLTTMDLGSRAAHEDYRVQCGGTAMLSRPNTTVRAGHWREVDERSA